MSKLGSITVSPIVIKEIILETLKDIPNVVGITKETKNQISGFFKSGDNKKTKDLEVEMSDTECVIDLSITVKYGSKLVEVAENVQEIITKQVEELSGIKVKEVNVIISKIEKIEEKVEIEENVEEEGEKNV